MNIRKDNGYYISNEPGEPYYIGIDSNRIPECIEQYHLRKCNGIFGHQSFGFRGDNLDFLSAMPDAISVSFWDCRFRSVEGLYALNKLQSCGVMSKRPGIDYSRFSNLQELTVHWNSKDTGISASSIKRYQLWHYNPKYKTFAGVEIPSGTEELRIAWFNPSSLHGLPVLSNLTTLQLQMGRNLSDASDIKQIAPHLQKLFIDTCKHLKDPKPILGHITIDFAYLNNRIIIGQPAATADRGPRGRSG